MTQARCLILTGSLLFLAACSQNSPTAPSASAVVGLTDSATAAKTQSKPFGGSCDTALTIVPALPDDPQNLLRLHIEYTCQLQHLGRTQTAVAEQTVTFTGPTTAISSNTTTYTAANGDQLFASWTGTSVNNGPAVTFSGPEVYTGGTGRFAGASGSSFINGTASFITNTGQFTMSGTLSY